jgi:hypothetical protein
MLTAELTEAGVADGAALAAAAKAPMDLVDQAVQRSGSIT